ncbi:hypothetical protein [Sphingomonas rubra]|uniref:hypothetical protein n=1 Tax=Sphingomonas rubra TaxID=634430 RepID=UPI000B82C26C|nr:hypothetical protein [Sphingomonas rubra]
MLTAIRVYRREHGRSPTLGEISRRASVRRQHVPRYLLRLQIAGHLTYDRHATEPIVLNDPAANLSDIDLENGCHGRGWTVVKSIAPMISATYPIDPATPDWALPSIRQLARLEPP